MPRTATPVVAALRWLARACLVRLTCLVFLVFAAAGVAPAAHALDPAQTVVQRVLVPDQREPIDVTPVLSYFVDLSGYWRPDAGGGLSVAEFEPLPAARRDGNFGTGEIDTWFRVELVTAADSPVDWLWVVENPGLDLVEVRTHTDGQPPRWLATGDSLPPGERAFLHRWQVVPLELPPDSVTTVYMRVRTAGAAQVPVRLWRPEVMAEHDRRAYALYSAYFGLLAGLLLYNLLLYFSIRDRAYLYYVGFAGALGLWQFVHVGFLAQFFWPGSAQMQHYASNLPVAAGCALAVQFAREFLQTAVHSPRLDRLMRLVVWAWGLLFLLGLVPALSEGLALGPWLVVVGTVVQVAVAVDGLRQGRPATRLFTLAWGALWLGAVVLALHRLNLLPDHPAVTHGPMIGSALEMVLLSLALADRIRIERQSRERARAAQLRSEVERDMVRRASDEKSRFLAAVSHDMRQPLYALTLAAESLSRQRPLRNPVPALGQMQAAIEAAEGLLDSVMTVALLEVGALRPRADTFSLEPLFDRLDATFGPQAAAKGLRWSVIPSLSRVTTDATLLQRILFNLVSNAVTYTETGGILVGCRRRRGGVLVQVWDTGPGLRWPAGSGELFEHHFRGEPGTETDSGVGLGLLIVEQTAVLLGLELTVRTRLGRGTCFSLWVPEAANAEAVASVGPDQPGPMPTAAPAGHTELRRWRAAA